MTLITPPADYDSPWKEALEEYLEPFIALCFPHMHGEIDWSRPYEFLDGELQQVMREAETGRRYADKLVRVWLRDGHDAWVLIHIEVQSQQEQGFAKRMFVYWCRIFDRYDHEVVSLFRFIDWLLALPGELEREVRRAVREIEEERKMPYITSIERLGREEGLLQGRQEGLAEGLAEGRREGLLEGKRAAIRRQVTRRFGEVPPSLEQRLGAANEATLDELLDRVLTVTTVDAL